jgi:hypothetical protein
MLKVKGKQVRYWDVNGNPQLPSHVVLSEIELPPVNPEEFKDGQTVLLKGEIFRDDNYPGDLKGNISKLRVRLGNMSSPILEGYADSLIVAIIPEEKKEKTLVDKISDFLWDNRSSILDDDRIREYLVEKLVKEGGARQ